ncbi:MAG: hypothetical protein H0X43_07620 [Nitrosospira sp.]|nr:hypothetical protein [Nitrosospira sp.]
MRKKQLIGKKPAYFQGQLLLKDDFIDEQKYHIGELARHNLNLHGWGVVRGLEVTAAGDSSLSIGPGFAVDGKGRAIAIGQAETLELSAFPPSSLLQITASYETEQPSKDRPRIECYGILAASTGTEEAAVTLATVQLDSRGKLKPESISTASRRQLHTPLSPGSVNAEILAPSLRKGWLRVPFRPIQIPHDQENAQPPFRVGTTEARSHKKNDDGTPNTKGAGGTMAISLPPGVTRVHRLRIAGEANDKKVTLALIRGGWNPAGKKHVGKEDADKLLTQEISGGPYDQTYEIAEGHLDAESSTLSVEIRSTGYCSVSLIAVEISH